MHAETLPRSTQALLEEKARLCTIVIVTYPGICGSKQVCMILNSGQRGKEWRLILTEMNSFLIKANLNVSKEYLCRLRYLQL